jgi:hypothetical protein
VKTTGLEALLYMESRRSLRRIPQFDAWLTTLAPERANRVTAAMDAVEAGGPTQGRPLVDRVKGSRHHNMKELRTGSIRALFVFDQGGPLMLVGGDKRGAWQDWYKQATRQADRLYDQYRRDNGKGVPGWRREPPSRGR